MIKFFIFILIAYLLGDLPKNKKNIEKYYKSSLCGDWGWGAIFLLIFRLYMLGDFLKIK